MALSSRRGPPGSGWAANGVGRAGLDAGSHPLGRGELAHRVGDVLAERVAGRHEDHDLGAGPELAVLERAQQPDLLLLRGEGLGLERAAAAGALDGDLRVARADVAHRERGGLGEGPAGRLSLDDPEVVHVGLDSARERRALELAAGRLVGLVADDAIGAGAAVDGVGLAVA